MHIGLQVPSFTYPGGDAVISPTLKRIAKTADDAGFYSMWVMDHFFQIGRGFGEPEDAMLEGYSALAYVAALTERVKLGTLVTAAVYRYPAVLVKTVTTLDVLSGGRAYLGIGAAWNEEEAHGLGIPYPDTKTRFEILEETLQLAKQMWTDDRSPFESKHIDAGDPMNHPQAISKPHPPILIGGLGEKKTLRMVAQYADACNLFARLGIDELKRKLDILREHCDTVGRDYDEIEKTSLATVHIAAGHETAQDMIETCRELASIGVTHVIVNMPNVHDITPLEVIGKDVIPVVAEF